MDSWKNWIVSDRDVLVGKPTVKGTRLSVEFILKLYANGWAENTILENYPRLSKEALRAVFEYVHDCMEDSLMIYPLEPEALAA